MRGLVTLLTASFLVFLSACGSSHSAPMNPVFTSTPGTAAEQGVLYSYTPTANDPSGGAVTFSLTASPAGASLNSGALNWTPSASESRTSNSFILEATTSSGGTASQSWTVTPTGTVTINWVNTFWGPTGPQPTPVSSPTPPSALVPQSDGSLLMLPSTMISPGVYTIVNVPGGYYFLIQDTSSVLPPIGFWTSSSNFDLGRDLAGSQLGVLGTSETTTFDFNLSGLDPSLPTGAVAFNPATTPSPATFLFPQAGATTYTGSASLTSRLDWTTVTSVFLAQYEPVSLGPLNNLVMGPQLTLSNLSLVNGGTNQITGTLTPSPQASIQLSIPGSQWAPLFQNIGPSPATTAGSWLSVGVEPYVTGVNARTLGLSASLSLLQPNPGSGVPESFSVCPGEPFFVQDFGDPAIVTDQNFGTLQYGDPFPAAWTRAVNFCQSATIPFQVPGVQFPFPIAINSGISVVPSNSPLAPLAAPVVSPTINGSSLFTTTSVNNLVETVGWTAPSGVSPTGYQVIAIQVIPIQNGVEFLTVGAYTTAKTSITLPPLQAGNNYIFVVVTQVDGAAKPETSPYRSQLPTAFATVMSSQITVNAAAPRPLLRGDQRAWQKFLNRKGTPYRMTAPTR